MKHKSIAFLACLVALALFSRGVYAGTIEDVVLRYSAPSSSYDCYADGLIVPDGECYALVWSPAGKSFSGFNADGTPASELDRVVLAGPLAKDGRCRDVLFQIPKAEYDELKDGCWAVCLVDTRRANGVPAGCRDGRPLRVNRWGTVSGAVEPVPASSVTLPAASTTKRGAMASPYGVSGRAAELSSVPASLTPPTITELRVADGVASLWVADTVDFLTYTVESCESLGNFKRDYNADKADGVPGHEILLETDAPGTTRFFRIIRAE